MKLKDLNNKTIALFGFGIENQALLKYLLKTKVSAQFIVFDLRPYDALKDRIKEFEKKKNVVWLMNGIVDERLFKSDIAFRSPGWPLFCPTVKRAIKSGVVISTPMQLFCDLCPTKNLIGVTGTKGKGTTSSLVYAILKTAGKKVYLGGNIGVAPFLFLKKLKPTDYVVLELSSFQLEDLKTSFRSAIFTNFSPEHLKPADPNNPNFHKDLKSYFSAKLNILRYLKKDSRAFINKNLRKKFENENVKKEINNPKINYFEKSDLPSRLVGEHNRENISAAVECAKFLGIDEKFIAKAVKNFAGLEHRIEFAGEKGGVKYFNDSFATIPDATITALKSFFEPIILIAGGADKGNDFNKLAREIKKRVKFLILFSGEALPRINEALEKTGYNERQIAEAGSMEKALGLARKQASDGDIVLLSPACASFGIFRNYKERGDLFKKGVLKNKN